MRRNLTTGFTFAEVAEAEPRLRELLEEAQRHHDQHPDRFCANAVWYGFAGHPGIRPRLLELVGWERPVADWLNSMEAYNVAYDTIYDALPACRGCGCLAIP